MEPTLTPTSTILQVIMEFDVAGTLIAATDADGSVTTIIPPVIEPLWAKWLVLVGAYIVTLALSGDLVKAVLRRLDPATSQRKAKEPDPSSDAAAQDASAALDQRTLDTGAVIGKCENIITVTFVLLGQATGLAIIFAAKSLVRKEEIMKNPGYYLGGTLVNLVWGILVALAARVLVFGM